MSASNTDPAILDHTNDGPLPTLSSARIENNVLLTVSHDSSNVNQEIVEDNIQIIDGSVSHYRKRLNNFLNPCSFVWLAFSLLAVIVISIVVIAYMKGKTHSQESKDTGNKILDNTTTTVKYPQSTASGQQLTKKVLFIIADGIPADVIEAVSVTNIQKITKLGRYKKAYVGGKLGSYSETPTVSAPGYMNLITGTWANKHNVYDNNVNQPNYNYKNIFRFLKEQEPQREIAIFSTWVENRLKLVGENLAQAGSIIFDYKFDGYELNLVDFPHDTQENYMRQIDEHVIDEASKCIQTNAPDLSWIYLENTDAVGHRFGDSEQFNQSVLNLDNEIGRVWEAIQYRENHFHEDWLIIITTDHGRDLVSGHGHGQQSDRERTTWIVMNENNTNAYFDANQPAIVDLLPTMARFLDISIPVESARELDGIPLIGNISLAELEVNLTGSIMVISWKVFENIGNVTIWLSTTNLFKIGKIDNYQFMGTVPVNMETVTINVKAYPSNFYKILLVGRYNMVNTWLFRKR